MIQYNKDCEWGRLMLRRALRVCLTWAINIPRHASRIIRFAVMWAAVSFFIVHPAVAQNGFPSAPIRIVLGFPAGGGNDAILRVLANKVSRILEVPVIVDNKPGANGNIAGDAVAKAAPDGYTLLWNTSSMVISPWVYASLNYDYTKDLAPIVLAANIPMVLTVPSSASARTLDELISYLKNNPGKTNYASTGTGNIIHLTTVRFLAAIDAQATHVPYRGDAPVVPDLISGRVQFYIGTINTMLPLINSGKIRGLAVTSAERLGALPELPTLDQIAPGVVAGAWSGVMAPAGTPQAVIAKLNAAFTEALQDTEIRKQIEASGAEILGSTPEQYNAFLMEEKDRWGVAVKSAGLKPE